MNKVDENAQFNLSVPASDREPLTIPMRHGDILFVLGANGTGKSSLIHRLYADHTLDAIRIAAHRQTWLRSSTVEITARQKQQQESQLRNLDIRPESRWQGSNDSQRPSMAVFNLIDAENSLARQIASAFRTGNLNRAQEFADDDSPLERINELLKFANLPMAISIEAGDELRTARDGDTSYTTAEMSDGERNAILIAADILTAKPNTLFLIDEPERHLHRSIITPLLGSLFSARRDCSFVISTHEIGLPVDFKESRSLLLRSCRFKNGIAESWDVDLLTHDNPLDEQLQRDVLGGRRMILFVEGKASVSLDQPLYTLLFPDVSVVPKGGQGQVLHSVKGLRAAKSIVWVDAFGIVDRDNRSTQQVSDLRSEGIFALDWYSVESIYYHPKLQMKVAERRSRLLGGDPKEALLAARKTAISKLEHSVDYIIRQKTADLARRKVEVGIPTDIDLESVLEVPTVDVPALLERERDALNKALADGDLEKIIERYPIRKSGALDAIATNLGFQSKSEYERAVLRLVEDDDDSLSLVKSMFEPLLTAMTATKNAGS
ncbi:MAG: AAA family ATPase [Gemmatimonadota bacterium]|nr:AAA family ATPase [Gemmatimonadota bacterium]